jgi:hypothetical protein
MLQHRRVVVQVSTGEEAIDWFAARDFDHKKSTLILNYDPDALSSVGNKDFVLYKQRYL